MVAVVRAMEHVHLAPSDEDDLYSGYNEYPAALNTKDLQQDEAFQQAVKTSHGRRPAFRGGTASTALRSSMGSRGMNTAMHQDNINRPMTAVRGAGYTSSANRPGHMFDPMNQSARGPAPPLEIKKEDTPEEKIKQLEKKVNELIEESCLASSRGEVKLALDKAKEASAKEKSLIRMRDQAGLKDGHNLDMTFNVLFNLANQYGENEMYTESLNTYQIITKNRMFSNAGRLKMNMGNIYFKQGQYAKAIKFYRMALDQVPNTHKDLRIKIMNNIGILFVKMAQYSDACTSFEYIMQEKPDYKTGLHLLLCYYSLGDKEKMKKGFQMLLEIPPQYFDDEEKYTTVSDDPVARLVLEVIKTDSLRRLERQKKQEAEHCILTAAKLISPTIEATFTAGYDWCVDTVKGSPSFSELANDLEINKAVMFLKQRDFAQAVETLKAFEKKETKVASTAATNLTFLYFQQDDYEQAEKYGEQARQADSYNAGAFVNLGNCSYMKGDYEKAKEMYVCALENDASCVEALYNLGLANKRMAMYEEALEAFLKLQNIIRNHPQVLYQIGSLYEHLSDNDQATEWYLQLLGIVPTDPSILQKMGAIYLREGDKQQAYHYHFDSYRYYPSNIEVLDWLGMYYVELQVAEKAISYFDRAALMQPDEPKWPMTIASCHRRSGNYHRALETYKKVHRRFPDNIECLKFLIRLCTDMGLKEVQEYLTELKKAERAQVAKENRASSSRPGSRRLSGRLASAGRSGSAVSMGALTEKVSNGFSSSAGRTPRSMPGSALSLGRQTSLSLLDSDKDDDDYVPSNSNVIDASYSDPIGPLAERPKTSAGQRGRMEDEFADEEIGDDLLPE